MSKRNEDEMDTSWLDEPEQVDPTTPLDQLRHLAKHANSEQVRVQALRVLLERGDSGDATEPPALGIAREVMQMSEPELDASLADFIQPLRDEPPIDMDAEINRRAAQRLAEERSRADREEPDASPVEDAEEDTPMFPAPAPDEDPEDERPPVHPFLREERERRHNWLSGRLPHGGI